MRIGIRTRVVILGLVAALPLFALDVYEANETRRIAASNANQQALLLARTIAAQQADSINSTHQLLFGFGTGLASRRAALSGAGCEQRLQQIAGSNALQLNVALADMDGRIRCSAFPLEKAFNVKDRPYFQRAIAEGGFVLSGLLTSRDTGGRIMVAAQAVRGNESAVDAVLIASFDVETLSREFDEASWPAYVVANLVTSDGQVIARRPHVAQYVGRRLPDFVAAREEKRAEEGLFGLLGLDGESRHAAYVRIPHIPSDPLYVVTSIPRSHVDAGPNQRLQRALLILAAELAAVLALGFIGAQMLIVRPLRQLTGTAKRFSAGDLTARTGVPHDAGEVGALASALDNLAESNQHVTRALRALSAGNRTVLRERNEQALLQAMCRVAVEQAGYRLAHVNYAVHDARKSVRTIAKFGHDEGFVQQLDLTWAETDRGLATVGPTIRSGTTTVIRSIRTDPRFAPWRDSAIVHGFGSVASFPLRVEGAVIGTFTLMAAEEDAFDRPELELLDEMAADLAFGIEVLRSNARRSAAEEQAQRAVTHDRLTGLPGRIPFLRAVEAAVRSSAKDSFAVIVVHLQNLQDLQDGLGYDPANAAVIECASKLKFGMNPATQLARPASDEFGLLLPRADATAVADLARRLHALFDSPVSLGGVPADLRIWIGATLFPVHGDDPEILLRRASIAAREAQHSTAGFSLYAGGSERENPGRLTLAVELRQAIAQRTLALHYQPKIDLKSGALCGAEALVRWPHPQKGMISPDQFVPIAEQTGLIRPLTSLVIELAARQLSLWRGVQEMPVAVNLSTRNLHDPRLLEQVEYVLSAWKVAPALLDFEITESALASDPQKARVVLNRLRELGCKLYIDDFGTGYSSLSYLVSLPVQSLKIDRSFVQQMVKGHQARSVVASIIRMASELHLQTVAEGVETAEQVDMLHELGCDQAQGYLFGRPVAPEEFKFES